MSIAKKGVPAKKTAAPAKKAAPEVAPPPPAEDGGVDRDGFFQRLAARNQAFTDAQTGLWNPGEGVYEVLLKEVKLGGWKAKGKGDIPEGEDVCCVNAKVEILEAHDDKLVGKCFWMGANDDYPGIFKSFLAGFSGDSDPEDAGVAIQTMEERAASGDYAFKVKGTKSKSNPKYCNFSVQEDLGQVEIS